MADEVILRQPEGESLKLDHHGAVKHQVGAELLHSTAAERPLVHMLLWDEDCCKAEANGRITLSGDEKLPVHLRVRHGFDNEHQQSHRFDTTLQAPVHHALQMRTPLQVRFCNTWQIASDYSIEIRLGDNRVIGVHLTGATVAKPLPCDDEPCPPATITHAMHP